MQNSLANTRSQIVQCTRQQDYSGARSSVSKRFSSILGLILFGLRAAAQQQQQPTITIQKSAELVTIPVLVTDKSGKPVHGLTKQDFTVKEDGKIDRPIAVFEELQATPGPIQTASNTKAVFSN